MDQRPKSRKRLVLAVVTLGAAAGACVFAHHWWTEGRFREETDDAYVGADIVVTAPKVSGRIAQVAITDNQEVHAGDLLVVIDDRDFRATLARAEAEVNAKRAALEHLEASQALQSAVIAQAHADLTSAKAETQRSTYDYTRTQKLVDERVMTARDFEQADADYRKANAAQERRAAGLDAALREVRVITSEQKEAAAAVERAIAERDIAKIALEDTRVFAPVDGVVGNRSARVGAYVSAGSSLLSIVPARGLWVDANFKESQLGHVKPGQIAYVIADIDDGRVLVGRVASLAPATGAQFSVLPAENATGNFTKIVQRVPVRIALEGDAGALGWLRPGLSVTAEIDIRDSEHVLASAP